jgi:hypothetical protein
MKKISIFSLILFFFFVLFCSPLYADLHAQITALENQKAMLEKERDAVNRQLSEMKGSGQDVPEDKGEIYAGQKPDINEVDLSAPTSPPEPRMTDDIKRMMDNIEIGPDGKPRARLEDVLDFQKNTQMMRDLKNAPPDVREAFNRTLRDSVYDPHDAKLIEFIRSQPGNEYLDPDDIKIDDFRTPREGQTDQDMMKDINTDRDYRVLVKDKNGDWIEVDTRIWRDRSQMILSETSGFEPPKGWDQMTPEEKTRARDAHQESFVRPENWERMTPEEQINAIRKHQDDFKPPVGWNQMTGDERMRLIREHTSRLQQMQTDGKHVEASRDYSDQGIDPETGKRMQLDEPNILKVKRGEATLLDAEGTGLMYREKVEAALRDGNTPEAIAQVKKAVDTLTHVREGYARQGYEVGTLPKNLQEAMDILAGAKTDTRANPAEIEQKLRDLGFQGGVAEVSEKLSSQIGALGTARQTTGARVRAAVEQGLADTKKGIDAHDEAKKVTEVAVKLADGAYTAKTWSDESEARATANQQISRRNERVDQFYTRYDSDPEFRRSIDDKVGSGSMRLPDRAHVQKMEEAGIAETLGLESVQKDGSRIALNVLNDIDNVNSVLKLSEHASGGTGIVGQMARSEALQNVKGSLGTTAAVAGNVATVVNTSRNVYEAGKQYNEMSDALRDEQAAVQQANQTLDRYRATQQRVQSEVTQKHGGNWHDYVASKRSDFHDLTPIQQAELVQKIQTSATKKVENVEHQGWSATDIDVLGSIDAGLTNAPVVGGVYTSGKNILQLGSETVQLGEALHGEYEAENRSHYTQQRVGNADNIEASRLVQARDNYRKQIADIQSGAKKERGLSVDQLEARLADIEKRLEGE